MKKIVMNLAFCALVLSGCAGMPDMSKTMGSSIANMVPGGSKFAGMADSAVSVAKDVAESQKDVPEPQEIELGENIMTGVLGAAPLYNSDRIQRYVNDVGRWVAQHSERPNLPWRFAVLESNLPNAGAAPGGQIYITTGLLFRLRSEAELAGALGHEIAHVVQRHHVKAIQKSKLGSAFVTGAGAAVDQSRLGGSGVVGGLVKTGAKMAIGEFRTIMLLKLDRGEEEQADRMGMVLAARAGYDPFGLANVLQLLQDLQKAEGGASLLYETHPSPADRIASLDASMSKEMEKYAKQPVLQERFITAMLGSMPAPDKAPAANTRKAPAKPPAKPKAASPGS